MTSLRRNSHTVEFKFSVVAQASLHRTAAEFCDRYCDECGAKKKFHRLCNSRKRPLSTDLDQKVFEVFGEERGERSLVINDMLRTKAVQIAGGLNIQRFKGSYGWLWKWKKTLRWEWEQVQIVLKKFPLTIVSYFTASGRVWLSPGRQRTLDHLDIVNMDQTMCRFDMPFSCTRKENHPY